MRVLRIKVYTLAAGVTAGVAVLILLTHVHAPSADCRTDGVSRMARPMIQTSRSSEVAPSSDSDAGTFSSDEYPNSKKLDAWLSVAPLQRRLAVSPAELAPFQAIIDSLRLSAEQRWRLIELLVERSENLNDADRMAKEEGIGSALTLSVRTRTDAVWDHEIESVVGTPNMQVVREMLKLAPQLSELANGIGRQLSARADALSADQMLSLAEQLRDAYAGSADGVPIDRMAGFDPSTGLGSADRRLLGSAGPILRPTQWNTLQQWLAHRTYSASDTGGKPFDQ